MIMIRDKSGRFPWRPHWEFEELEERCEQSITAFLLERYGFVRIPVPTEAITLMIERDAGEVDFAAKLEDPTYEIFGFTEFEQGKKPRVCVSRVLWSEFWRANRLRTTLAHEYGHLLLHTWLYDRFGCRDQRHTCYRRDVLTERPAVDWMEWQAGYASGALLMPASFMRSLIEAYFAPRSNNAPVRSDSAEATELSKRVAHTFEVSVDAARVRLSYLGCVID